MTMAEERSKPRESTQYIAMGASIGALGAVSAIVGAAVCPVCVVATPALLGIGFYKRWREREAPAGADTEKRGA